MRILIILLLATQIQAQVSSCDSITYWTDQGQGLSVGIDTSTILNGFDSIDIYWGVCNSSVCYSGSGINSFFGQITTSDTIKVCYNIILYTANTFETCPEYCDSLIYDGFSWVLFSMSNPVGIVETQNKINNNKMYDLFGREILKPKGLYIQNNQIKYER